tara:strand:- start:508 stop:690 length:183 start_codon:yes stop_codon:yes gene_type:complete
MEDFFEIDNKNKTIKNLNLDDLSIDELRRYIDDLKKEITRVEEELARKKGFKNDAEKLFS